MSEESYNPREKSIEMPKEIISAEEYLYRCAEIIRDGVIEDQDNSIRINVNTFDKIRNLFIAESIDPNLLTIKIEKKEWEIPKV
jgi:hypothetical protein